MSDEHIVRLYEWIEAVKDWNEGLKKITLLVEKKLAEYKTITDDDRAVRAAVDLLFMRNRLEHMIKIWLGENKDEDD